MDKPEEHVDDVDMSTAVGDRVGCILTTDEETKRVFVLGFGERLQNAVPETAAGDIAKLLRETETLNPHIRLDGGEEVWGCECWWGPEDEIKDIIGNLVGRGGYESVNISITEVREEIDHRSTGGDRSQKYGRRRNNE